MSPKIQFSLNQEQEKALSALSIDDESPGLTAKRLLLGVIEGEAPSKKEDPIVEQVRVNSQRLTQFEESQERIELLESVVQKLTDRYFELKRKFEETSQFVRDQLEVRVIEQPIEQPIAPEIQETDPPGELVPIQDEETSSTFQVGDKLYLWDGKKVVVDYIYKNGKLKVKSKTLIPFKIDPSEVRGKQI